MLWFQSKVTTAKWEDSHLKGDRGLSTNEGVHSISLHMKPLHHYSLYSLP